MPKIKLVIFDAGDILYDYKERFKEFIRDLEKLWKDNGANIERHGDFWETENIGWAASVGKISLDDARRRQLKALGLPERLLDKYNKIDVKAMKKLEPKDSKIREIILEIKKRGYKVAVLSDTPQNKKTKKFMMEVIGVGDLFDEIFVSSEIGHMKPDKEAYFAVLNHFGLKTSEVVFVAHDEDELMGAKELGIKTISYQGHKSGDFLIKKFGEILGVLEKLG